MRICSDHRPSPKHPLNQWFPTLREIGCGTAGTETLLQAPEVTYDSTSGNFSATVFRIGVGQTVKVTVGASNCEAPVTSVELDWGRVRAVFTSGAMLSKENQEFSEQGLYMDFTLDKNWRIAKLPKEGKGWTWLAQTFFNTRLTALPVTSMMMDDTMMMEEQDAGNEFLRSRKAAQVQAGIYFPIFGEPFMWEWEGSPQAVFFAPIAKAGFQTLTSNDSELAEATRYEHRAYRRCGQLLLRRSETGSLPFVERRERSPRANQLSRSDLGAIRELCDHGSGRGPHSAAWTPGGRGSTKNPALPLVDWPVDANLGKGPDDVRFIFGARFDVARLFAGINQPF